MAFVWKTNESNTSIVTIYETNITLNKAACHHFENVNYVLLGVDEDAYSIGIKPVTKDAIDQSLYPPHQLYRLSVGKSYGRITNKPFISELKHMLSLDFHKQTCYKFMAHYDIVHDILIVDFKGGPLS